VKINLITIQVQEYERIEDLTNEDKELAIAAIEAAKKAYAPYSEFQVGAAVKLCSGKVIMGNNQENAAYPSGLCAERVAVFYANAQYPDEAVETVAIAAYANNSLIEEPVAPCGSCRQVLLETEKRYKQPIRFILIGAKKILIVEDTARLLPLSFSKENLLSEK